MKVLYYLFYFLCSITKSSNLWERFYTFFENQINKNESIKITQPQFIDPKSLAKNGQLQFELLTKVNIPIILQSSLKLTFSKNQFNKIPKDKHTTRFILSPHTQNFFQKDISREHQNFHAQNQDDQMIIIEDSDFKAPSFSGLCLTQNLLFKSLLNYKLKNRSLIYSDYSFVSHLHFDTGHILSYQISGNKKWTIISPNASKELKPNLFNSTVNFSAALKNRDDIINNLWSNKDIQIFEYMTSPGDVIYIPQGWWHTVETTSEDSISMNYHWSSAWDLFFNSPMKTLLLMITNFKKVLSYILPKKP